MAKAKKKIIKFIGGLGNQMFQYALGKAIEKNSTAKVLFDITSYGNPKYINNKRGLAVRKYEMHIFQNANIKIANKFETLIIKFLNLIGITKKYKEKDPFKYDESIFVNNNYSYFTGYYQNENYFKSIREELIKDFELPAIKENDDYNRNLLEEIKNSNNSVFIHVRREDYIPLGYCITLDYYKKAVEYIKTKVENPTFFVFCAEDEDYIKNEFDIGCKFKFIGEKNKTRESFYENMRLMKACKHAIIANSSYSWWAAWLNEYKDKIVIAPSPWLKNDDKIICDNWVKIKI